MLAIIKHLKHAIGQQIKINLKIHWGYEEDQCHNYIFLYIGQRFSITTRTVNK